MSLANISWAFFQKEQHVLNNLRISKNSAQPIATAQQTIENQVFPTPISCRLGQYQLPFPSGHDILGRETTTPLKQTKIGSSSS